MKCIIQITLNDGSQRQLNGIFSCTVDALIHAIDNFPFCKRISVTSQGVSA